MIHLRGLSKRFGARTAVLDLDLEVPAGSIYGLLGHNGAGKSTTLGMILGQVFPDRGTVAVDGHDTFRRRALALRRVGAILETPAFHDYLSGETNLRILCEYTGPVDRRRLGEVVELVGLEHRIGERVGHYSHGMRQRLALAQALLPDPALLILDEPADGLDPEGIHEMRRLIRRLHREWGLTILFSSHQLHEVEQVCTHVAVMRESRLLYDGPWPPGAEDLPNGGWFRFEADRQAEAAAALRGSDLVRQADGDGRAQLNPGVDTAAVNRYLVQRGFGVRAIGPVRLTLEEFYLQLAEHDACPAGDIVTEGDRL